MQDDIGFDWKTLGAFIAAADHGSLSAAARETGVSQPTLGRHVTALERQLGVTLFRRTGRGLRLTEKGAELLEHARAMEYSAQRLIRAARGQHDPIEGVVRISASDILATYLLPPMLSDFRRQEPGVEVELATSPGGASFLRREADIAVRARKPEQSDVIAKQVSQAQIGIYASPAYLYRRGRPRVLEDLLKHDVIGDDRGDRLISEFRAKGLPVKRSFFAYRCDDQVAAWRLVVAGAGIGFMPRAIGDAEPGVERILQTVDLGRTPIWLIAHDDMASNRRIKATFDYLAVSLSRAVIAPGR